MNLLRKIQYNQYWNIGFCEQTPEELVHNKALKPIRWLKHPYRDRWFADPFILKVTEREIMVFVEECSMDKPKGIICELLIDRQTMELKSRHVILELETHLSYPAIIRFGDKVYVYPENGASGKLNIYEYDERNHRLVNPVCVLEEAVADATILEYDDRYLMCATKCPQVQERAFLYEAESLYGPFKQIGDNPFQENRSCSRPGGNWFTVDGCIFRPAQDCVARYGSALSIMKVTNVLHSVIETKHCWLAPINNRYGLGLHTLNFTDGLCVVDGCGYFYPVWGNMYYSIRRLLIDKKK